MNIKDLITQLREEYKRGQLELRRLDAAISALAAAPMSTELPTGNTSAELKRRFSAAARHRISAAQKMRWAKFRAERRRQTSSAA